MMFLKINFSEQTLYTQFSLNFNYSICKLHLKILAQILLFLNQLEEG